MKISWLIGVEAALGCLWISLSGGCQPRADRGVPAMPAGRPAGVTPQAGGGFAGVITGDPRVDGRVYLGTGRRGIVYGEPLS